MIDVEQDESTVSIIERIMKRFDLTVSGNIDDMELDSEDGQIAFYKINGLVELESCLLGIEAGVEWAIRTRF